MNKEKHRLHYSPQIIVFVITYLISVIALYVFLFWLLDFKSVGLEIVLSMLYFIACFVLGLYLNTLFSIPQKLPGTFDDIKNRISSGETTTPEQFARELNEFLIDFYNYSFFDVHHAVVKSVGSNFIFSEVGLKQCTNWDEIEAKAKSSEDNLKNLKVKVEGHRYYINTFPIYFMEKYLGFFSVLTTQRLGPYKIQLIRDLENNYIDDQMIRVIPKEFLQINNT